jgi:hypothetical protein
MPFITVSSVPPTPCTIQADEAGPVLLLVCCLLWRSYLERWKSFGSLGMGNDIVHGCLAHCTGQSCLDLRVGFHILRLNEAKHLVFGPNTH